MRLNDKEPELRVFTKVKFSNGLVTEPNTNLTSTKLTQCNNNIKM